MKLLLLDGPRDLMPATSHRYRGTERAHPTYCDCLPEQHEINKTFFWFLEEGGEAGVVHNLEMAKRYTELLNQYAPERRFELIEVTDGDGLSKSGGRFLGFDLSLHYNSSLLSWGLKPMTGLSHVSEQIQILCGLLSRAYEPQLNENGLFSTYEVAATCLQCMIALQALCPNLFEGGGSLSKFKIVGLYALAAC